MIGAASSIDGGGGRDYWRQAAPGPVHISSPKRGWSAPRLRSVAAAFACEMGVFCGEVRLKISVLGVFLAVEWGSKGDWCEDLLIFFRNRACLSVGFAYITRDENRCSLVL